MLQILRTSFIFYPTSQNRNTRKTTELNTDHIMSPRTSTITHNEGPSRATKDHGTDTVDICNPMHLNLHRVSFQLIINVKRQDILRDLPHLLRKTWRQPHWYRTLTMLTPAIQTLVLLWIPILKKIGIIGRESVLIVSRFKEAIKSSPPVIIGSPNTAPKRLRIREFVAIRA